MLQSVGLQRGGHKLVTKQHKTMEERVIGSVGQRNQELEIIYIYLTSGSLSLMMGGNLSA